MVLLDRAMTSSYRLSCQW